MRIPIQDNGLRKTTKTDAIMTMIAGDDKSWKDFSPRAQSGR